MGMVMKPSDDVSSLSIYSFHCMSFNLSGKITKSVRFSLLG